MFSAILGLIGPNILQIIAGLFSLLGWSEANIKRFTMLVEQAQRYGLITVELKDQFADQKKAILARIEAKKKLKEQNGPDSPPQPPAA